MRKRLLFLECMAIALVFMAAAFAQGTANSSVSGTVHDSSGAVIPGAEVKITNPTSGAIFVTLTNDSGNYTVAAVPTGTYTVTVSTPGFKTSVHNNVKVDVAVPAVVNVVLEVGQIADQVVVSGGAEMVNVTSASIGTTVDQRRIQELPLSSRDALDLTMLQAGVATTGNPRSSVVDGLRKAAINITIDGVNVQDNNLRSSDGYFTYIRPRIDAVEEFTITTSTATADSSGGGAVNIRFATRSGSNDLRGSAYWYHRNPVLNANYYFNNLNGQPRQRILLNQPGVRVGGPIMKDKLFYFVNYEEYLLPDARYRTRTILTDSASKGLFEYLGSDNQKYSVDLLSLAQKAGYPNTIDPLVAGYISTIKSNATSGLNPLDLRTQQWNFNNNGKQRRIFPTSRIDWKITSKISYELIGNYGYFNSEPDFLNSRDPFGPGFDVKGSQKSNRWSASTAVRWAVNPNITNEARYGMTGGTTQFYRDIPIPKFMLSWPLVSNPYSTTYQPSSSRNAPGWNIIDNLSWNKGKHFMSMGAEVTFWRRWQETVSGTSPLITLSLQSTDPADAAMFTTANFPRISSTDLGTARSLYALLVGRVSGVSASIYADEKKLAYVQGASLIDRYKSNGVSFYWQDAWRMMPSLTWNYGLRWDFMGVPDTLNKLAILPVGGLAGVWGVSGMNNLFKPGTLTGSSTMLDLAGGPNGKPFFNNDWNNFAPSIGFAWTPNYSGGILRKLFGEKGTSVFRGGYNISYIRDGFFNVTAITQQAAGSSASGRLVVDQDFKAGSLMLRGSLPPLNVSPAAFSFPTPQQPLRFSNSIAGFDPNIRGSYTQSWSFGFEREIFKDTVLEIRYVGNHGTKLGRAYNINEINIFENGFLAEFKAAQNNLAISRAQGKGDNFRNQGLPGQVNLPIYTAVFGSATSSNFGSATYFQNLDNGNAGGQANTFSGNASFFNNLIAAGYPLNFWKANPDAPSAIIASNAADSNYHSLQIEMRRRMSKGIFTQVNYTWGKALSNDPGNTTGTYSMYSLRDLRKDYYRANYDITHRMNLNFIWEPPIGRGRSYLSGGVLGKILEGWQFGGVGRMQSGNPFWLSGGYSTANQFDAGVVPVGTSIGAVAGQSVVRYDQANRRVYYFPASMIASTGRAEASVLLPASTPGVWGDEEFILDGPDFARLDASVVKKTYITERMNVEFRAEFFDIFNNINFSTPDGGVRSTTFGRITGAYSDVSTTNDPGGRWIQFVLRINW